MENNIECKMSLSEEKTLKAILEMQKTYTILESINKVLSREQCKFVLINRKFEDKFGLDKTSLLSEVLQRFYEIGFEEGLKSNS